MDSAVFDTQMLRMQKAFERDWTQPRYYAGERLVLIWRRFQKCDGAVFEQIVDTLISENLTAPVLGRFEDVERRIERERERIEKKKLEEKTKSSLNWQSQGQDHSQSECKACKDIGSVYAVDRSTKKYRYSFHCWCKAGQLRAASTPKIPTWGKRWDTEFMLCDPTDLTPILKSDRDAIEAQASQIPPNSK